MSLANLKGKYLVKLCKAINRANASIEFSEAFYEKLAKELTNNLVSLSLEELINLNDLWINGRAKTSKTAEKVQKQFLAVL